MKLAKILGIIIIGLILLVIIIGLIAPKKYQVERFLVINAPRELVFEHVVYWKNWNAWSPWAENDPQMNVTILGVDGQEGSTYKWVGDPKKTGEGEMTNTGVKEKEEISYHLHFIKPWESHSDGYVRLSEADEGTKVTWGFYGETPFPWNIFMLFMSMDKMISKDYDRGLELLKNICEKEFQTLSSFEIKKVIFPARSFATIEREIGFDEMTDFFRESYSAILQVMNQKKVRMIGAPVALYYTWDEQSRKSKLAAGIPIFGSLQSEGVKTIRLSMSSAYTIDYHGAYEGLKYAHQALNKYFQTRGLRLKPPVIEEYITDPMVEPDTAKWLTKIYYFSD